MHLGNLLIALLSWLDARAAGGAFVLRIEDLDPDRCRPAYAEQLADDLRWLGLDWDEGYQCADGESFCQSNRSACYEAVWRQFYNAGKLYPCYCTRAELISVAAPHAGERSPVYDGRCRELTPEAVRRFEGAGRKPAWRIRVPDKMVSFTDGHCGFFGQNLARECGDFVIRRADHVYTYQLAVSVDDAAMQVTRVVRGRDLLDSTPRQIWLMREMRQTPPQYFHAPLLLARDGRRLSKRDRDVDMSVFRQRCVPEQVIGFLAALSGLLTRPEACAPRDLLPLFSWERVPQNDIVLPDTAFLFPDVKKFY